MEFNNKVFEQFPLLESKRLFLRMLSLDEAAKIFEMRANQRINEFILRPQMQAEEDAKALAQRCVQAFDNQTAIAWAGFHKESGTFVGSCGFNSFDKINLRAEIGGELSLDFWGKQLALEAVITIMRFGFEQLNLHSIEAKILPENRSAIYLAERLGFVKEAHFRDRIYYQNAFHDLAIYTCFASGFQGKLIE